MIDLLSLTFAATMACVAGPAAGPGLSFAGTDSTYQWIFESGIPFATFLERAERRKDQWAANYRIGAVPDVLLARARAVMGTWKVLVVAVDGCSDSVNTIPYIARLFEALPGVELRIVNSEVGKSIMESHRTPDGRAATPTVLLLDVSFEERGCFIERPGVLRQLMSDQREKSGEGGLFEGKMKWYDDDKGAHTVEEMVAILEAAGRGESICR